MSGPYPPPPHGQFVPLPTQPWHGHLTPVPAMPPPGWGRLVVECSYHPMAMLFAATGPNVVVDGVHRGSTWGSTVLDLPAGQHHLHVHTRYLGQFGRADAPLVVAPGQLVHLYYRAPLTIFQRGRLGPTEQRSAGVGMLVAILGSAVLVVLLVLLIALVG